MQKLKIAFQGYELEIRYSPGLDAKTYGPPETCHPAEGPEIEVVSGTLEGRELTPEECIELEESDRAYEQMAEAAFESLKGEDDAYADRLYDELKDEGRL